MTFVIGDPRDGEAPSHPRRTIGTVVLDDPPRAWVDQVISKSTKDLTRGRMAGRRRTSRVREDASEAVVELRGRWFDGGGVYMRDFAAALLNQERVPFDLGDGTEYRMVDVLDVLPAADLPGPPDGPGQEGGPWAYVAQVLSYEPYTRRRDPLLSANQGLVTGAGAFGTNFDVSYAGTVFAEPTWQFTLPVSAGRHLTAVRLANTLTGEACEVSGLDLTNGIYIVLMDASGGRGGAAPPTPGNSDYGLLDDDSPGYGCSVNGADVDFDGAVPTLAATPGTLVPMSTINPITATITADAVIPGAKLNWLAPTRYIRVS